MRPSRLFAATACAAFVVTLTACADDDGSGNGSISGDPSPVRLYGSDGTMQDEFAAKLADRSLVSGMKGTAPMTELPPEFTNRLLELDSSLAGFLYAGEAYDAVVIGALAAELAGTPEPEQVRHFVKAVTAGGEPCTSVEDCLAAARNGDDFAYRGVTLRRGGFTDAGEPAATTYGTQHFGSDGVLDGARTELIGAGDESAVTTEEPPQRRAPSTVPGDQAEPLVLGGLLPETGALAFAYPPIQAGVLLAVADVNDAGGVFGVDVEWVDGDDGTSPEVALETLASHVEDGVHIIIGPAASGVTEAVLPEAVAARRVVISPSATAPHLTSLDHDGYFFRTAPSDLLQGAALADVILRDGSERIVIIARDDAYGDGLMEVTVEALRRAGVPLADITRLPYEVAAHEEEAEEQQILELDTLISRVQGIAPDAVMVIGYEESAQIIEGLAAVGLVTSA